MQDTQVEQLLRKAPKPATPPDLLKELRSRIRLPTRADEGTVNALPWWKRWTPALSFGVIMAGCLVVIAMQTSEMVTLRQDNEVLQRQLQEIVLPPASSAADDEELFAKQLAEVDSLKAEIKQLSQELAQLAELRKLNQALRDEVAAAIAKPNSDDPFAEQKAKADRIACIHNLKKICLAARIFGNDNGDYIFPIDFVAMRKELGSPRILTCPSDTPNLPPPDSWETFNPARVSYEWLAPGHGDQISEQVIARCRIHMNAGLCDGSAHQLDPTAMEYFTENGIVKFRRRAASYE
jgi:hypothetical protein